MLSILSSIIAIYYKINFLTGIEESFQKVHTSTTFFFVVSELQLIEVKCVVKQQDFEI